LLYAKDPINDPYFLFLCEMKDWTKVFNEYKNYYDTIPFLEIRKIVVLVTDIIILLCLLIYKSNLYQLYVALILILNLSILIFNFQTGEMRLLSI
jgi:hypothetical protein